MCVISFSISSDPEGQATRDTARYIFGDSSDESTMMNLHDHSDVAMYYNEA